MSTRGKHDDTALPDGWRMVRLGEVAQVRKGRSFTSRDLIAGEIPVIAGGTTPAYYHAYSNREANTITISASGAHAGFVAFHASPILATDCSTIGEADTHESIAFIYQVLKHNQLSLYYRRRGSAQPHVYPEDIGSFRIALPSLPEQRAIADVLDSIDDAIERTETVVAATEILRDSLIHELLTHGVPGWHTEWKDAHGIGTIPADWEVVRLGEVIPKFEYGTSVQCDTDSTGVPVLRIPNIASGELDLTELKYATLSRAEMKKLRLATGDVLLVRTNGNPEICGQSWVTDGLDGNWAFASYIVRGRPDQSRVNPGFAGHFMRSEAGRRLLRGHIRTSAGNYNLSVGDLGSIPFPCPPLDEQVCIVDSIGSTIELIDGLRTELGRLNSTKRASADALLNGYARACSLGSAMSHKD